MMKKRKSIAYIIFGALMLVLAVTLDNMIADMRFENVSANVRDLTKLSPAILFALGGICVICGVILVLLNLGNSAKKTVERQGRVLGIESGIYDIAAVEFENGVRERLVISDKRKTIISVNDVGVFTTKGKYIMGFQKTTY